MSSPVRCYMEPFRSVVAPVSYTVRSSRLRHVSAIVIDDVFWNRLAVLPARSQFVTSNRYAMGCFSVSLGFEIKQRSLGQVRCLGFLFVYGMPLSDFEQCERLVW